MLVQGRAGRLRQGGRRETIGIPCYDGNGMFTSMGNLLANPQLGLLFIDFEKPNRLRLNGTASIVHNDPLLAEYHEAQFVVRVTVKQMFPNCPRYIPRFSRVEHHPTFPRPVARHLLPTGSRSTLSATRCRGRI